MVTSVKDIAATRVVSPVPGIATFTTIAAALASLPMGRGRIYLREGTYTLPSTLVYPDGPVVIEGSGADNTIIDLGANPFPVFTVPPGLLTPIPPFVVKDLTLKGAGLLTQHVVTVNTDCEFLLENVKFDNLATIFNCPGVAAVVGRILNCESLIGAVQGIYTGPANGTVEIFDSLILLTTTNGIIGSPFTRICDSLINKSGAGAANFQVGANSHISDSRFVAGLVTVSVSNCRFSGSAFFGIGSGIVLTSGNVVSGCHFLGIPGTSISVTGSGNIVNGCNFPGVGVPVMEAGAADNNRYDGNRPFLNSIIIGPNSIVEGWRRDSIDNTTGPAFVTQFTRTQLRALRAVGTIKNTGGATLEIQETATDLFGITDSLVSAVLAGADTPLGPELPIGTARPPYSSYSVAVRDLGVLTSFQIRCLSNGGS